jgi:cell wall-associated NlpC family hydrolase
LMVSFMEQQIGLPYSEEVPERFGPFVYDCSGLVWAASDAVNLGMPGGPDNDVAALVVNEMYWLGGYPGAQIIPNQNDLHAGDILAFVGGDPYPPPPGTLDFYGYTVAGMGHIGMAVNHEYYISAYDTEFGVCIKPISGDVFVIGVRLPS